MGIIQGGRPGGGPRDDAPPDLTRSTQRPQSTSSGWFGQPRGLTILFLTEMWERFSYYGMRALLVYYIVKGLGMDPANASRIYGFYTASVYFTPIIGGAIADRWLGRRRSVLLGGTIIAAGHMMMGFPALFFPALTAVAVGNGFFLPSLAGQIDELYEPTDPRRGGAYSVYYVGINLGGFLAPLVCGFLGEIYGWHYGFGAAALGMLAGMSIYVWGQRWLPRDSVAKRPATAQLRAAEPTLGRPVLLAMAGIILAVVVFRGAYEQIGNSIALWADTEVNRRAGGWVIPATWFQSLNPLLVFCLTPLLVRQWIEAARAGRDLAPLAKMSRGGLGLALSFLVLLIVTAFSGSGSVHWLWLALFVLVYTAAELYILPVGLGLFGRVAPSRHKSKAIAAWYLAAFAGSLLAGWVGSAWSRVPHGSFFALMVALSLGAAAMLLLLGRTVGGRQLATLDQRDPPPNSGGEQP